MCNGAPRHPLTLSGASSTTLHISAVPQFLACCGRQGGPTVPGDPVTPAQWLGQFAAGSLCVDARILGRGVAQWVNMFLSRPRLSHSKSWLRQVGMGTKPVACELFLEIFLCKDDISNLTCGDCKRHQRLASPRPPWGVLCTAWMPKS